MRKSTTAQDRKLYPNFFYNPYDKSITRIKGSDPVDKRFTPHHFIRTQWIRHNKEKVLQHNLLEQQKIYFLPTFVQGFNDLHSEAHRNNRDFFGRWGFERSTFIFDEDSV